MFSTFSFRVFLLWLGEIQRKECSSISSDEIVIYSSYFAVTMLNTYLKCSNIIVRNTLESGHERPKSFVPLWVIWSWYSGQRSTPEISVSENNLKVIDFDVDVDERKVPASTYFSLVIWNLFDHVGPFSCQFACSFSGFYAWIHGEHFIISKHFAGEFLKLSKNVIVECSENDDVFCSCIIISRLNKFSATDGRNREEPWNLFHHKV